MILCVINAYGICDRNEKKNTHEKRFVESADRSLSAHKNAENEDGFVN